MMLAVLLQVRGAVPATPVELITGATTMTKVVLVILALLSLLSWAIMVGAWRELAKASRTSERFLREFERAGRLDEAGALVRVSVPSALTRLFSRAMHFVSDTRVMNQQQRERQTPVANAPAAATLTGSQIETLHLLLESEAASERDRLGRYLPWLATIGSASPLIGLLGTVLGVIDAFIGIATKGSGNLSAVAPGVAEALIATAAALAVAIPATFGYNIFANRLNRIDGLMESFGTATIALLVREGQI
ncbi:MAG TPA: MotA/TolQ/ExbB proton channel family protein [Gemmatimonadaceae bacterium]|nr:MotA/TolQ/ExbB proton channel family protein [Gemmatimonadaceae bacterium]